MRARLLLVDDDLDILQTLAAFLTMKCPSAAVSTARDGREALAVMEREPADLVVADFKMPRVDGIELVAAIHEKWPDSGTVLLTAYPDLEVAIAAINRGQVRHFLTKPVDPSVLASVVGRLLDEHFRARVALGTGPSQPA